MTGGTIAQFVNRQWWQSTGAVLFENSTVLSGFPGWPQVEGEGSCSHIPAEMPACTTVLQFLLILVAGFLHRQKAAVSAVEEHQNGPITRRPRLGRILNYYEQPAV